MIFRIHFVHADGTEDSFIVEGRDVWEVGILGGAKLAATDGDIDSAWSEQLSEEPR